MDARPILATLARVLAEHRLEAVLIGNAAAGRPRDRAVLEVLERTLDEKKRLAKGQT